jgi:single-strand DNA-binding protein
MRCERRASKWKAGEEMYETNAAVIGTVITTPVVRKTAQGDDLLIFRMASNARRQDRATGEWSDNGSLYLTVTCWRRLAKAVGDSIQRGDPIIAYGSIRTSEYRAKDGTERSDLEMRASAVGPDLARCWMRRERLREAAPADQPLPASIEPPTAEAVAA